MPHGSCHAKMNHAERLRAQSGGPSTQEPERGDPADRDRPRESPAEPQGSEPDARAYAELRRPKRWSTGENAPVVRDSFRPGERAIAIAWRCRLSSKQLSSRRSLAREGRPTPPGGRACPASGPTSRGPCDDQVSEDHSCESGLSAAGHGAGAQPHPTLLEAFSVGISSHYPCSCRMSWQANDEFSQASATSAYADALSHISDLRVRP